MGIVTKMGEIVVNGLPEFIDGLPMNEKFMNNGYFLDNDYRAKWAQP